MGRNKKKRKHKEKSAILTIHRTWGSLNPCDRIVESKKKYSRKKVKKVTSIYDE